MTHPRPLPPISIDHERERQQQLDKLTYGELYERIHDHPVAKTENLLAAAEVAKILIYNAVCIADEQDDEEFFGEALAEWPAVVEAVMEDLKLDERDPAGCRVQQQ